MSKYYIKLNNKTDSENAQTLLSKLGAVWAGDKSLNVIEVPYGNHWILFNHGYLSYGYANDSDYDRYINDAEEISLNELKDLVAQHGEKEYLDPLNNYKLVTATDQKFEHWVEVPEGAIQLTINDSKTLTFWKDEFNSMNVGEGKCWVSSKSDEVLNFTQYSQYPYKSLWQRNEQPTHTEDELLKQVDVLLSTKHAHYFINVSDIDEMDFYEVASRFNVTDPCIQHILKKCLATGNRGHKDFHHDMQDIHDTAVRMLAIHGIS